MGFKGTGKSHSKDKTFSTFVVFTAPDFYKLLMSLKLASEDAILISKSESLSVCDFLELLNILPLVVKQHMLF